MFSFKSKISSFRRHILSFLANLSQRLKFAIVTPHRLTSSVCLRPSVNFSHFRPLLRNHWTDFEETWRKVSTQGPLPTLCFLGRFVIKDRRPGLWLADTFFLLLLGNHWTDFDETWQEASTQGPQPTFCFLGRSVNKDDHPGFWLAETYFDIFSASAEWILTKLDRK